MREKCFSREVAALSGRAAAALVNQAAERLMMCQKTHGLGKSLGTVAREKRFREQKAEGAWGRECPSLGREAPAGPRSQNIPE